MEEQSKLNVATKEELESLSVSLSTSICQIDMLKNYLDLLSFNFQMKKDHESLVELHMTLFDERALGNMSEILSNLNDVIYGVSCALDGNTE